MKNFPIAHLAAIAKQMGLAARAAGVQIATGDTKVVDKGHGDGCYINTAGIGVVPEGVDINPSRAPAGDIVIISGTIGDHGMAIMSVREGLEFETVLKSDSTALNKMVASLLQFTPHIHDLRDPTRGGLATSLNEIAAQSKVGILIEERSCPSCPMSSPRVICSGWTRLCGKRGQTRCRCRSQRRRRCPKDHAAKRTRYKGGHHRFNNGAAHWHAGS